jgi:hypothetical protein
MSVEERTAPVLLMAGFAAKRDPPAWFPPDGPGVRLFEPVPVDAMSLGRDGEAQRDRKGGGHGAASGGMNVTHTPSVSASPAVTGRHGLTESRVQLRIDQTTTTEKTSIETDCWVPIDTHRYADSLSGGDIVKGYTHEDRYPGRPDTKASRKVAP